MYVGCDKFGLCRTAFLFNSSNCHSRMKTVNLLSAKESGLVKSNKGQVVTTSVKVAEYFGKNHRDVTRSIKELLTSAQFCAHLFIESEYPDNYGRMQPMYLMNRDGFSLLAMGFTGAKALEFKLAYINAFNEMEEKLRNNQCTKYAERIVKKQIKEFNQSLQETLAIGRKKHGSIYGGMIPYGKEEVAYNPKESMESNLKRIFNQVHEMCEDGFLMTSLAIEAQRKLKRY
nr:MAG TPA: regulatory protein [Caudoviricetes sp.]